MDGHQVVGLAARFRESPFKEVIKRRQSFQPPVLSSAYFAQITSKLDEARVFLCFLALLPGENLIDLRQHEERPFFIQLRRHRRCTSTQARQTHQSSGLPDGGSGRPRLTAVYA